MAKVKIQGHASGTGVLTVTAPNTSTDRTITLPDATGTLATTADITSLAGIDDQSSSNDDQLTIKDTEVVINEDSDDLDFRVESNGNANMLMVDASTDRIGIGIASPGVQFANIAGTGTNIGAGGINWNNSEASKYVAQFRNGADPGWGISIKLGLAAPEATDKYIDFIDDDGVIQSSLTGTGEAAGGLAIQTAGTERLKIASAGDVTVSTGDLIFGTAGKGVCLGVTSNTDANTLDDYEEGTYTPTMSGSSSGNFVAGTNSLLTYTKVGRLVTVTGKLEPNTDQSLSGTIYFTLPFTSATDTLKEGETAGNVFMRSGGTEIPNNLSVIVGAGQTTTYISWAQADSSSENIGHNQVDGAFDVWFGFTYCAA